jgi:hypothetical protein
MNLDAVMHDPSFNTDGTDWRPLGDTGYWARIATIQTEIQLAEAVEALQGRSDTLRLPPEFITARRQKFLEEVSQKTAFEEAEEQARVIFTEMAIPYRLTLVTGPPGAAKTTVTSHWVRAARQHNPYLPIVLITAEKEALHRLQDRLVEAVPDLALTLEEAVSEAKKLPKYACFLIDEAGLIDTASMATLLENAVEAQASRVVLIGDDKQLLPSGVGQPFRWIRESKKAQLVELPHSFRQKTPHLREAITDLYRSQADKALQKIEPAFVLSDRMIETVQMRLRNLAPEKTLILLHADTELKAKFKTAFPTYRVLTLNEAQGLAFDQVVFLIAQKIDLAAMLVGCSRERYVLNVFVDEAYYPSKTELLNDLITWNTQKMALDILPVADLLDVVDQG